jgi:hypothetical protein
MIVAHCQLKQRRYAHAVGGALVRCGEVPGTLRGLSRSQPDIGEAPADGTDQQGCDLRHQRHAKADTCRADAESLISPRASHDRGIWLMRRSIRSFLRHPGLAQTSKESRFV